MRYIKASELNSFSFCNRAWFLERNAVPTELDAERALGAEHHVRHEESAKQAIRSTTISSALFVVGACGILAGLAWWLFQ
jgi:hypothetical protein